MFLFPFPSKQFPSTTLPPPPMIRVACPHHFKKTLRWATKAAFAGPSKVGTRRQGKACHAARKLPRQKM